MGRLIYNGHEWMGKKGLFVWKELIYKERECVVIGVSNRTIFGFTFGYLITLQRLDCDVYKHTIKQYQLKTFVPLEQIENEN